MSICKYEIEGGIMTVKEKFNSCLRKEDSVVLGIESSCDETAAAVVKGRTQLSNVVASQIEIHQKFGGVVPEIASRNHTLTIMPIIDEALKQANLTLEQIDAIAVTAYPGLVGSLLVGVSAAKALSYAKNIPLIACNHIESHICANYLNPNLKPPFLALTASGGHTSIIDVLGYNDYQTVGKTTDDAIGEAFDKVGRILGLSYPGGPEVDKLSKTGKADIVFMRNKGVNDDFSISYSGLKTAVVNYVHGKNQRNEDINVADICASFTVQAVDMLVNTLIKAAEKLNRKTIVLSGGACANSYLREKMSNLSGYEVHIPPKSLCTDNALMVALRGFLALYEGRNFADLTLNAKSYV